MNRSKQTGMGTKMIVFLLIILVIASVHSAEAQQQGGVPRIGYLHPGSAATASAPRMDAFRQGLRDLGYFEGKNIVTEWRYADGKSEAEGLPELAAELVRIKVDVIVTTGTPAVRAIKRASATIPIVFAVISHPVENGIVASFARPGGNVTGLTILTEELSGKRLELLKETVPNVTRIGVLSDLSNPTQALEWKEILAAAQVLGVKLQSLGLRSSNDFDSAFKAALRERAQALITLPQPLMNSHRNLIVGFAAKNKLPAIYPAPEFTDAGGLMYYGPVYTELFRRAATYVDKILKGTKPADLPVEQPTKFELVINLKTAKALGLTIPPLVMMRAEKVIK
jgi:putative tryptophan/tyrosine transport system substrate-binding protein